jgi:peptidyl-prolyl cis-trans isomerase C
VIRRADRCACFVWSLACLWLALGLTGCPRPSQDADVLVIVNGKPITLNEFNRRWTSLPTSVQARYRTSGGDRRLLEEIIGEELLLQEARRLGLDQSPLVRDRLERLKEQLVLDELVKHVLADADLVSEEEADAYMAAHPDDFRPPEQVRIAHIVVPTLAEAKDIKRRYEQGTDFSTLASRFSRDGASRAHGGELGTYKTGDGPADEESAFIHLKPGAVSDPIETESGFRLVKLLVREPIDQKKVAMIRHKLKQELRAEKRRKRFDDFTTGLRARATIRMAEASKLVIQDTGIPPSPPR